MKGRTLVIGILVFVLLVVGVITFAMLSTINGIKEEMEKEEVSATVWIEQDESLTFIPY